MTRLYGRPNREVYAAEQDDRELTERSERERRDLQREIAEIERSQEIGRLAGRRSRDDDDQKSEQNRARITAIGQRLASGLADRNLVLLRGLGRVGRDAAMSGRGADDLLFGRLSGVDLVHDASLRDHVDPVAEADEFEELRGNEHNRGAPGGEFPQTAVDFELRCDIDALGRLVEHVDFRRPPRPAAQNHFLLVAAAQERHPLFGGWRPHREIADRRCCRLPLLLACNHAEARPAAQIGDRYVLPDGMDQKEAFPTTVCGHINDAARNSLPWRAEPHGLAVEFHSPLAGNEAEQAADDIGLAISHDTAEAHDLARRDREAHVLEPSEARQTGDL